MMMRKEVFLPPSAVVAGALPSNSAPILFGGKGDEHQCLCSSQMSVATWDCLSEGMWPGSPTDPCGRLL